MASRRAILHDRIPVATDCAGELQHLASPIYIFYNAIMKEA